MNALSHTTRPCAKTGLRSCSSSSHSWLDRFPDRGSPDRQSDAHSSTLGEFRICAQRTLRGSLWNFEDILAALKNRFENIAVDELSLVGDGECEAIWERVVRVTERQRMAVRGRIGKVQDRGGGRHVEM